MNLTEWAHAQGIDVTTAYRWYREGKLPVPVQKAVPVQKVGRLILVSPETASAGVAAAGGGGGGGGGGVGLYAGMSSHDQKADLDLQVARLSAWTAQAGLAVLRVESEVGSAMNGARAKVRRLLADPKVTTVVVEHRDRLGRMNTELVGAALSAHKRRLVVFDGGEVNEDLVREMVEVLTSFCARLYGRRSARNPALKALGCAQRNIGPQAVVGAGRHDVRRG